TQSERVARIARAGFRVAGEDRQGADSDRVGHRSPRRQKTYLGTHVLSRLCAGGNGHGRSRLARGESDAAGYRICGHRTAADSAVGRRSQSHRLQSGRQPGKAEAQGQVRKGRDGAHWRGSVRHLYGRSRRRERRSRDVESDGHDFWPVDSGGIGIWAGGESRVAARAAPKGASEFGGFAVSLKRYPDTKQRLRSAEPKILDSAAGRRGKPRLYTRREVGEGIMAKRGKGSVKLQIAAGKATPAPPVGPALGQAQVNIMEFCKQFNARTGQKELEGLIVPVVITVYSDRTFTFITKTPPASILLKRAAGIAKGSGAPNKDKVGKVTLKQVEDIAK